MQQFRRYLILVDNNLNISESNADFLAYLGMDELQNLDQVVPPQDYMQLKNALFAVRYGAVGLCCFRIRISEGTLNWIAANMEKPDNDKDTIKMELSDIQSLKEESVLARYDKMTGLLNKQAIIDFAKGLTEQYPRHSFYLFLMDIDHFKSVNDTFGHMRGDEIIVEVAGILQDCVGDKGRVGRIGGDEFMIVFEKINTEPEVRECLRMIRDTVREKYENMGENISITVSLGGALFPDYAIDYDKLFKLADKMLYCGKVKGRDRYIIYTPSVHGRVEDADAQTVSHYAAKDSAKTRLLLDTMDAVISGKKLETAEIFKKAVDLFDLDHIYVFDDPSKQSILGVEKSGDAENITIPILASKQVDELFNENSVAVLNIFDMKKDLQSELKEYMEQEKYRVMVIYRSAKQEKTRYYVYLNDVESSCRLSGTDLSDLTYLAYLVDQVDQVDQVDHWGRGTPPLPEPVGNV